MRRLALWIALAGCAPAAQAQEEYGAKGIFPVYETSGQWVIFDKKPNPKSPTPVVKGERYLVVGSAGAEVFEVARSSGTYGGSCRAGKPLKLKAGLLIGPRRKVGRPIIGIHVPPSFTLKGSRAEYTALKNEVSEATYAGLGQALRASAAAGALEAVKPESIQTKIDFGATVRLDGVERPFVFVEETQTNDSYHRCLRLASGDKLIGDCAEMPRTLMAETALLQFVSYDPSGKGSPFVLAFTRSQPLWGDERWAFVVRDSGPRLFLMDAMDIRCREGF